MKKAYLLAGLFSCWLFDVNAQFKITNTTTTAAGSTVTAAPSGAAGSNNIMIGNNGTVAVPAGVNNTFVGQGVGAANTSNDNTFIGKSAGAANTSGSNNTFVGKNAGLVNTTGYYNSFIGTNAGAANTTGIFNTFLGQGVGGANTTGYSNTFLGQESGANNTTGYENVFIGKGAGRNNTIGMWNTFIGFEAGEANIATRNTFIGMRAGKTNTSGDQNTMIGFGSGFSNTTGGFNCFLGFGSGFYSSTGSMNTFNGYFSGQTNTSGSGNAFYGSHSGYFNGPGNNNTFIGQFSGYNSIGNENLFIGRNAGKVNTIGNYNTVIGTNADVSIPNLEYATAIGYGAVVDGFNAMVLGGTDLVTPRTNVNVGIGTRSPVANLHLEANKTEERMLVNTTRNDVLSLINLRSGTPPGAGGNPGDLLITQVGAGATGVAGLTGIAAMYPTALPVAGTAPALPWANLAMVASKQSPLYIGTFQTQTNNYAQNIYFVTGMDSTDLSDPSRLVPWECLRINQSNGFVGIHTRTAATAGTTGAPQALFHVNLTNPGQSLLNPLTNGIRFEGLPNAAHPNVVVIDANGNLAQRPYGGGPSGGCVDTCYWNLDGNVVNPIHFIGSRNAQDFRIRTSNIQRGRVTADGNFDFGTNTFTGTAASGAFGNRNDVSNSASSFAAGQNNKIGNVSDNSGAIGEDNNIDNAYRSFAAGVSNAISNNSGKGGCVAIGARNMIRNSNESVAAGESNTISNGHGCFTGGGHNIMDGQYNISIGDRLITSGTMVHAYGHSISNNLDQSMAMGFDNNRTMVLNKTGVAVQLDPTGGATYKPTVNFEVQAGVAPSPTTPLPIGLSIRSNVRLHNLPPAPDNYPTVVIDPTTGELFMANAAFPPSYKMGSAPTGENLQPINNAMELIRKIEPKKYEADPASGKGNYAILPDNLGTVLEHVTTGAAKETNYNELIPILVQALKDQQAQLASQQKKIDELIALNDQHGAATTVALSDKDVIRLDQSIPNPASQFTSIGYYLPATVQSAMIRFVNMEGKVIRTLVIDERGTGSVKVSLAELGQGTYTYSLIADGRLIDTKKMVVAKQ